jgi:hypothetical protein
MVKNQQNIEEYDFPNIIGDDYLLQVSQVILNKEGKNIEDNTDEFKYIYADLMNKINMMLVNKCPEHQLENLIEMSETDLKFEGRMIIIRKILPAFDDDIRNFLQTYKEIREKEKELEKL